ncbi:hypothetical protein ACWEFJ_06910 [Actinosynnema sp. NPDC004786]
MERAAGNAGAPVPETVEKSGHFDAAIFASRHESALTVTLVQSLERVAIDAPVTPCIPPTKAQVTPGFVVIGC